MKKIAILGSTGHIAKGLIDNLAEYDLALYSRSKDKPLGLFPYEDHDVIINCIGVREKLWTSPYEIFRITERFDNMCLDYLEKHPETLYINFSSGAVFGNSYENPASDKSVAVIDVNGMKGSAPAYYGISKLNSEAKHRALDKMNIVDIRVYSYVSEYLRPDDLSIINEIFTCLREGKELATSPQDFFRDYIHPKDLARLVRRTVELHHLNTAFDAFSLCPISKFEMLAWFANGYGLKWRIDKDWKETSPTGPKPYYYSNNTAAQDIGYAPQYESLDAIAEASEKILNQKIFLPQKAQNSHKKD